MDNQALAVPTDYSDGFAVAAAAFSFSVVKRIPNSGREWWGDWLANTNPSRISSPSLLSG